MSTRIDQEFERAPDDHDRCPHCVDGFTHDVLAGEPLTERCGSCGGSGISPREDPEGAPGAESIAPEHVARQQEQDPPDTGEW